MTDEVIPIIEEEREWTKLEQAIASIGKFLIFAALDMVILVILFNGFLRQVYVDFYLRWFSDAEVMVDEIGRVFHEPSFVFGVVTGMLVVVTMGSSQLMVSWFAKEQEGEVNEINSERISINLDQACKPEMVGNNNN